MFTVMQSMEIAHEIQAGHRRRAATSRLARWSRRQQQAVVGVTAGTAPVVVLPRPALVAVTCDAA